MKKENCIIDMFIYNFRNNNLVYYFQKCGIQFLEKYILEKYNTFKTNSGNMYNLNIVVKEAN